jgi:hypothetical protein
MALGPDWRQHLTHLRWIGTPEGRPALPADAMVMPGLERTPGHRAGRIGVERAAGSQHTLTS